jgi:hypothetical protein
MYVFLPRGSEVAQLVGTYCAYSWEVAGSILSEVFGLFIDIIFQAKLWPWGRSDSDVNEKISWDEAVGARTDKFVAFMCRLLEIVGGPGALMACSGLCRECFDFISVRLLEIIKESKLAAVILFKTNNLH